MKKKKSIIKAYRRKWQKLSRNDRIFVIKFLSAALLILVIAVILLCLLITHISHSLHSQSQNQSATKKSTSSVSADQAASSNSKDSKKTNATPDSSDSQNTDTLGNQNADTPEVSADNEEVQLLAKLVNAEAGDASRETQIAVASVILNRVQSDIFPNTIYDVIYQEGQYPPTQSGTFDQAPNESSLESALYVYQNGSQIPANVLYQSYDVQGSGVWAEMDGNYFCYE